MTHPLPPALHRAAHGAESDKKASHKRHPLPIVGGASDKNQTEQTAAVITQTDQCSPERWATEKSINSNF